MWKCSLSIENHRINRAVFSEVLILFRAFWRQDGRDSQSVRTNITIWSSSAWSYLPPNFLPPAHISSHFSAYSEKVLFGSVGVLLKDLKEKAGREC